MLCGIWFVRLAMLGILNTTNKNWKRSVLGGKWCIIWFSWMSLGPDEERPYLPEIRGELKSPKYSFVQNNDVEVQEMKWEKYLCFSWFSWFSACDWVRCFRLTPELRLVLLLNPLVMEYPPPLVPVTASQQIIHEKILSSQEYLEVLSKFSFVFSYVYKV